MEFVPFPKISRLFRPMYVTEKIDGTNAQIWISEPDADGKYEMKAGSRNRWITPSDDNHGFAKWCELHRDELVTGLGTGSHFGEWWGQGIQRTYGLKEKRFSLFNVFRWQTESRPACCDIVPVLFHGIFDTNAVDACVKELEINGSRAVPGFMKPEGVMVYHVAGNFFMKKTILNDGQPKSVQGAR